MTLTPTHAQHMGAHATKPSNLAFWLIFSVIFIDLIGFGIVFPVLPQVVRQFGLLEWQSGLVIGSYSLMQFVFAPILGQWSDRIGRKPVLLVSIIGTAASYALMAFSPSLGGLAGGFFVWFLVARALDGIAGSNMACAQAFIADCSPPEQRTRNLGMWIGAAFGLGFALGPVIGGCFALLGQLIWPSFGPTFPFLAAGVLALLNAFFIAVALPESHPKHRLGAPFDTLEEEFENKEHKVGSRTFSLGIIGDYLAKPEVGHLMLSYALVIFGFAFMEATLTWLALGHYSLNKTDIYWLFGFIGVVISITQGGIVRRLSAKGVSDKTLAITGAGIMAASLALLPLGNNIVYLYIICATLSVGESLCQPSLSGAISKRCSDAVQGEAIGVAQSLASLSRFAGPLLGSALYFYGPMMTYGTAAIFMAIAIGVVLQGFKTPQYSNTI